MCAMCLRKPAHRDQYSSQFVRFRFFNKKTAQTHSWQMICIRRFYFIKQVLCVYTVYVLILLIHTNDTYVNWYVIYLYVTILRFYTAIARKYKYNTTVLCVCCVNSLMTLARTRTRKHLTEPGGPWKWLTAAEDYRIVWWIATTTHATGYTL